MAITNIGYANLPFYGVLPMMGTNYGGDFQLSTIPPYLGKNLNLFFNPMAQASGWGMPSFNMFNPMMTPQMDMNTLVQGTQQLVAPVLNQLTSQNINLAVNNIGQAKARLQAKMQDENITEEQRNEIQGILDKLKEQENKLNDIKNSKDLDPQTAYQKVSQIEADVQKLVREAINVINNKPSSGETDEVDDADNADNVDEADEADDADEADEVSQGSVDNFDTDTVAAVDQFYDSVYGLGTDDEKMEEVLDLVNKDNVMDLVLGWNKYHSAEKGESLMEAFMWDADASQKVKYGKLIARALRDKAEELGIYDECKDDFAQIDKEMGSWLYVSNDVSKNYDNIIEKIANKMGSKYGKVQTNAPQEA